MEKLTRTIKALSLKKIEEGSIGFITTEEENKWFNVLGEPEILKQLIEKVLAKKNKIEFQYSNGVVGTITLLEKAPEEEKGNWANEMTKFEDLLSSSHEKGIIRIITTKLEIDLEKKYALFKAVVVMKKGDLLSEFHAHGDATDSNIEGEFIKPHFIRMAETRAIARALRWATNNAACSEIETEKGTLPEGK